MIVFMLFLLMASGCAIAWALHLRRALASSRLDQGRHETERGHEILAPEGSKSKMILVSYDTTTRRRRIASLVRGSRLLSPLPDRLLASVVRRAVK